MLRGGTGECCLATVDQSDEWVVQDVRPHVGREDHLIRVYLLLFTLLTLLN